MKALPSKEAAPQVFKWGNVEASFLCLHFLFFFFGSSDSPLLFPFWCLLSPDLSMCLWLLLSCSLSPSPCLSVSEPLFLLCLSGYSLRHPAPVTQRLAPALGVLLGRTERPFGMWMFEVLPFDL